MRFRLAVFGFAALVLSCAHAKTPEEENRNKLPSITLEAVGPEDYQPAMLQNRVVLVHFMATWCFPCLTELPNLEHVQKRYAAQGFQVIAIGMDREGRKVLEPFAYKYRLPFPILVSDDEIRDGDSAFGLIPVLPSDYLFKRDGELMLGWTGVVSEDQLDQVIQRALK